MVDGSFYCEKEDDQAHSSVYTTNINHMLAINNLRVFVNGSFDCEKMDGKAHPNLYERNINHVLSNNNLGYDNHSSLILY